MAEYKVFYINHSIRIFRALFEVPGIVVLRNGDFLYNENYAIVSWFIKRLTDEQKKFLGFNPVFL